MKQEKEKYDFKAFGQAIKADANPHYGTGKGATIYWFTSDQFSSYYTKIIHTNFDSCFGWYIASWDGFNHRRALHRHGKLHRPNFQIDSFIRI